jgi:hypothetical protein
MLKQPEVEFVTFKTEEFGDVMPCELVNSFPLLLSSQLSVTFENASSWTTPLLQPEIYPLVSFSTDLCKLKYLDPSQQWWLYWPIPLVVRSEAWVCGRSLAGIAGSNPAGVIDVYILWMLCTVMYGSLRRTDHSPRGPTDSGVFRVCSWNLENEEALAHWGCYAVKRRRRRKFIFRLYVRRP